VRSAESRVAYEFLGGAKRCFETFLFYSLCCAVNDRKRTYFANERVALCLDLGNRPLKAPRCAPGSSSALESHAGGCEEKQRRGSVGGDYGACEDALRDRQREGEALKGGKGHTAEAHIDATAALPEKYKKLVDIYGACEAQSMLS
jgi:hypothetical protein